MSSMMPPSVLDQELQTMRFKMDEIVKDLHQVTIDIKNESLSDTVSDLRTRINEPFMFVIVGEVKAGKSSFVNALLDTGSQIVAVAPDPCTDTIQQILYGETEQTINVNPFLKKILLPQDILKEISIVDTPGTNTIIDHHQEITERFIPSSDLIVFVFEAKNPYRQSAWEFFEFIHSEWRKKIIFVLQQSDLLSKEDLAVNIKGVYNYAQKKGMGAPKVFSVSAKREIEKSEEDSGFQEVRTYIQENITGGKAPYLKLQNNIEISQNIASRILDGLKTRQAQFEADKAFRADVRETLDEQESQANKQVDLMVENLLSTYDNITRETGEKLNNGLGFFSLTKRSILSIFSNETSIKEWLNRTMNEMEQNLRNSFQLKITDGVKDLATNIQQMAKMINLKIQNSQTILKNNNQIFGNIADKRSTVLLELQEKFSRFMKSDENFVGTEIFGEEISFSPNIATGSGIAVIGVVLATVTNGMVFDITGGILTAVGFLFAGITVSFKKRKLMKNYYDEVQKGRNELEQEIDQKLKQYVLHIKEQIDNNFQDFDALLQLENKQLGLLVDRHKDIFDRLNDIYYQLQDQKAMNPS